MTIQEKGKSAKTQLFQKNLPDVVKGIRKHKKNEQDYIQKALQEIREELKHRDMNVKVIAVQKMTYLHMIGYNMEYGAFTIVEVMSSEDFSHKRIGYLACAQCFHEKVEMVQMIPNLLRNALKSLNQWEQGLALSCLSNICTPELAEILVSEVANLLQSPRPYIKKKTLLTLFKIFLQYPSALRPCFPRIKEKLDDPDPSVTAAAVNVICELARKNPKNYLGMAPVFFKLFSNIQNNWTLIKIVKVFGSLAPEEPRLPKKLAEPLSNCINKTPAKSLLYECLLAVASNSKPDSAVMVLAVDKLKQFVQDPDQNLKFLGLRGLAKVMQNSPQLLSNAKDMIIDCLADEDICIRIQALKLVVGLVSKRNLHSVVQKMQEQLVVRDDDEFRNIIVKHVVEMCKQQQYAFVTNFEWYLRVLMDLTQSNIQRFEHGALLEEEFLNVLVRVREVRPFGIKCVSALLCNPMVYQKADDSKSTLAYVLRAACYLASEYPEFVPNKLSIVSNLMKKRATSIPADVQSAALQCCLKLYSFTADPSGHIEARREDRRKQAEDDDDEESEETQDYPEDDTTLEALMEELLPTKKDHKEEEEQEDEETKDKDSDSDSDSSESTKRPKHPKEDKEEEEEALGIDMFLSSCDVDVHEHASMLKVLLTIHRAAIQNDEEPPHYGSMFHDELKPVKLGAQEHVELPEDIDQPIISEQPHFSDSESDATLSSSESSSTESDSSTKRKKKAKAKRAMEKQAEKDRIAAELARKNNPHYLPSGGVDLSNTPEASDLPPVQELTLEGSLDDFELGTKGFKDKGSKRDKSKKKHKMVLDEEVPEGWQPQEAPKEKRKEPSTERDTVWDQLDVDLSGPVKEALPTVKPYERKEASDLRREQKLREAQERKNKKKKTNEIDDEKGHKKPKTVEIIPAVSECTRHKTKKGSVLGLTLGVTIENNTKTSLKNVSLKIKDKSCKIEVEEPFRLEGRTITPEGNIKLSKGECFTFEFGLEIDEPAVIKAVVSYTQKDDSQEQKMVIVRGAADCMAKVSSKLTKEAFFEAMGQMNSKKGETTSLKESLSVPSGSLSTVLTLLNDKMRFKAVEVLDSCAALMANLVTPSGKEAVCLLLKASSSSQLSVELKTFASAEHAADIMSYVTELLNSQMEEEDTAAPSESEEEKPSKKEKKEKKKEKVKEEKRKKEKGKEKEKDTKKDKKRQI